MVEYPSKDATHEEVRCWWENFQPAYSLKLMARHLAALRGSQGATERTWARLSLQTTAIRISLLPGTKAQLLNIASNWKILYPSMSQVQLEKRSKNRDFVIVPPVQGRAGPAAVPEAREIPPDECPSSSDSSSSSSTSCSEAQEVEEE